MDKPIQLRLGVLVKTEFPVNDRKTQKNTVLKWKFISLLRKRAQLGVAQRLSVDLGS